MSLEACHPALRIFDVVLAKSFYLHGLDFTSTGSTGQRTAAHR
jgi:hypothetical protein